MMGTSFQKGGAKCASMSREVAEVINQQNPNKTQNCALYNCPGRYYDIRYNWYNCFLAFRREQSDSKCIRGVWRFYQICHLLCYSAPPWDSEHRELFQYPTWKSEWNDVKEWKAEANATLAWHMTLGMGMRNQGTGMAWKRNCDSALATSGKKLKPERREYNDWKKCVI